MRIPRLVGLLLISFCCSGCGVGTQLCRTWYSEVKYQGTQRRIGRRERALARIAWNSFRESRPDLGQSRDFARGFKDGFAGFLHTGWLEPPPVPPKQYQWFRHAKPAGYEAAQDWLAGYEAGALEGANSGQREWLVIPTSTTYPARADLSHPGPAAAPGMESLPTPEPLDVDDVALPSEGHIYAPPRGGGVCHPQIPRAAGAEAGPERAVPKASLPEASPSPTPVASYNRLLPTAHCPLPAALIVPPYGVKTSEQHCLSLWK